MLHASFQLGHGDTIPDVLPGEQERNEDFLKAAHHVLMEVLYIQHMCKVLFKLSWGNEEDHY